jgi:hypothetical protein
MKDIRLCDMKNGNISVFTRPQGAKVGSALLAILSVGDSTLSRVRLIESAPLLEHMFHPFDWGGAQ